ncbi:hypothetical protein AGMMS49938_05860 [Fibrobacterales bacterium]|nr:hypothetical protein AGMMS49938_05860 [Fibrobacterales bacterium]
MELILAVDCSRIGVMLGLYSTDFETVSELNEPNARGEEIAVLLDKLYESCDIVISEELPQTLSHKTRNSSETTAISIAAQLKRSRDNLYKQWRTISISAPLKRNCDNLYIPMAENPLNLHKNTVRPCRLVGSDELLTSSSEPTISPNNIKSVLVTLGPGSFTGIRAGIAFCEGFCFAKKRNLYGVSTLHALSMHTPKPILHARANYYYVWENGREELVQFDSPPQTHENLPITPFVRLIPTLTPSRIQKANYIVNPYEK